MYTIVHLIETLHQLGIDLKALCFFGGYKKLPFKWLRRIPPPICKSVSRGNDKSKSWRYYRLGEDVKVVMSGLARSPVGFVDTHYARFVNRMQRGQFILKLGLAWDVAQTEPLLFKPLMVEAREPGAGEIGEMFRRKA